MEESYEDELRPKADEAAGNSGWETIKEDVEAGAQQLKEQFATEPETNPQRKPREGPIARTIEQQTAELPSDLFLWAALRSIAASLIFQIAVDDRKANFVGHWAPTFLTLGIYNKLVKLHGSGAA